MVPPIANGSASGTFADKMREIGIRAETIKIPSDLAPVQPSCDLSPVDLRSFKDLPPEWLVHIVRNTAWVGDPSSDLLIREGYKKLDRYFEIDAQREFRSGNGDSILQAEEVEAYKATRGLLYGEDTCSLMKEARQFSQTAEMFKKEIPYDKAARNAILSFLAPTFVVELWRYFNRDRKGPPPGGGGTPPSRGGKPSSSVQEISKSETSSSTANFVVTDLVGQVHQMYGGAVYTSLSPMTLDSFSSHGKGPTLGIIPLVTPLPLSLPTVRPLPVLRPVPVMVEP